MEGSSAESHCYELFIFSHRPTHTYIKEQGGFVQLLPGHDCRVQWDVLGRPHRPLDELLHRPLTSGLDDRAQGNASRLVKCRVTTDALSH